MDRIYRQYSGRMFAFLYRKVPEWQTGWGGYTADGQGTNE